MPIRIQNDLPAKEILEKENIFLKIIICQNKFCVSLEFQMAKTYIEFTLTNCFSHIFMIYLP